MPTRCASCTRPQNALCASDDEIKEAVACYPFDGAVAMQAVFDRLAPVRCDNGFYPQDEARKVLFATAQMPLWLVDGRPATFAQAVFLHQCKSMRHRLGNSGMRACETACLGALKGALVGAETSQLPLDCRIFQAASCLTVGFAENLVAKVDDADVPGSPERIVHRKLDRSRISLQVQKDMRAALAQEGEVLHLLSRHLEQVPSIFNTGRETGLARVELDMLGSAASFRPEWFRYATLYHLEPEQALPICMRLSSRPDGQAIEPKDLPNYQKKVEARLQKLLTSCLTRGDRDTRETAMKHCIAAFEFRRSALAGLHELVKEDNKFYDGSGIYELDTSTRSKTSFNDTMQNLFFIFNLSQFREMIQSI